MVTGLILAGGASRRMGRNKALISLGGKPLIQRVVDVLQGVSDEVLLIANQPEPYAFLHLPIVPDVQPGYGPLMGLYSGLRAARGDLALLVAVDMPFLAPEFLRFLLGEAQEHAADVVIPEAGGRLHPLCAVYRRATCLPAVEASIARGQRRLIAFHPQVRVRRIPESTLRAFSPDLRVLMNVNTPEELELARAWAGE